jgi:hypothetical protein
MAARYKCEREEAAPTAPSQLVARSVSKAIATYPDAVISSTEYALLVIGVRCRLSAAVARKAIELAGIGGAA